MKAHWRSGATGRTLDRASQPGQKGEQAPRPIMDRPSIVGLREGGYPPAQVAQKARIGPTRRSGIRGGREGFPLHTRSRGLQRCRRRGHGRRGRRGAKSPKLGCPKGPQGRGGLRREQSPWRSQPHRRVLPPRNRGHGAVGKVVQRGRAARAAKDEGGEGRKGGRGRYRRSTAENARGGLRETVAKTRGWAGHPSSGRHRICAILLSRHICPPRAARASEREERREGRRRRGRRRRPCGGGSGGGGGGEGSEGGGQRHRHRSRPRASARPPPSWSLGFAV